jgi:tetratricopeptide (TPR) repeat protein
VALAQPLAQAPTVLGRVSFPNSGSAAAQPPFIRGVLLLHSFEYDAAIAAFREAERIDPAFALAYWGEAMSYNQPLWYNESVDKARAALAKLAPTPAARLAKAPTAREQGYLDAVERLYGEGSRSARDRAYADRMAALWRANPADDEAAAFYALALLATIPDGERNVATSLEAGGIALDILKRNPQHPGAAHYALHALDDGEHAKMGLEAARLYAKIAPASSHARHMPSHAFLPLGLWDEAAASDEAAYQTSVDLAQRNGLSSAQHDFHALGWLHYEYLQQGRFEKARALLPLVDKAIAEQDRKGSQGSRGSRGSQGSIGSQGARGSIGSQGARSSIGSRGPLGSDANANSANPTNRENPANPTNRENPANPTNRENSANPTNSEHQANLANPANHVHAESEIGRGTGPMSLRSERASMRARLVVESGRWELLKAQGTFDNVDELFALGLASVKLGDGPRAEAALEQLQGARRAAPDETNRRLAEIMYGEVSGLYQISRGQAQQGLATLASAAKLESAMPNPIARPYPIKPAGELYGEALLSAGDAAGAVRAFQSSLKRTPRRASSLIGLARAAKAAGQPAVSSRAAREFVEMWKLADPGRPELVDATRLARSAKP